MYLAYKSTGVVIPDSLSVSKALQNGVGQEKEVLDALHVSKARGDVGNVPHDVLGGFSLTSSTLTCISDGGGGG